MSNVVTLNVTTTTPTLTITSKPATVTFGKAATVTGRLTYPSGTTQAPVAGQLVWGSTSTNGTGNTYATTDANGDFTLTMPKVASASATVYVGTYAQNLLNATQDTFKLATVIHPTQIESPSVKLDQYWDLSVKGCLSFPSGDTTQSFTSTAGLELQYQVPDGKSWSAWKNLAAIPSNEKAAHCRDWRHLVHRHAQRQGPVKLRELPGRVQGNHRSHQLRLISQRHRARLAVRRPDRELPGLVEVGAGQARAHLHRGAAVLR